MSSKQFKVVVVGDEKVGKTSLIVRYTENRFSTSYKQTIGSDIAIKYVHQEDRDISLVFWDIGGQDQYRIMHKYYFQGAQTAVLVFSITDRSSFENLTKWHNNVIEHIGKVPLILLGNKIDLSDERVVSRDEALNLISRLKSDEPIKFFETSAKTAEVVEEAFLGLSELLVSKY
jgi:small GTP-binding protein